MSNTNKKVKTLNQKADSKSVKVRFGVWTVVTMFVSKKNLTFSSQTLVYSGHCCLKSNLESFRKNKIISNTDKKLKLKTSNQKTW